MSSTNKTPNYQLSQFVGSDKPAWLADYNQDMSKIYANLFCGDKPVINIIVQSINRRHVFYLTL